MTLREFRSMISGAELHIHTNHTNILHIGDSSQHYLRWISYVDEYGPELHYVEGSANVVADTFLRLAWKDTPTPPAVGKKQPAAFISNPESNLEDTPLDNYFSWTDDQEMLQCFTCLPDEECYLNFPGDLITDNPLYIENIKEKQDTDDTLQYQAEKYPDCFLQRRVGTVDNILCYVKPGDTPNNLKIALPKALLHPTIQWFHQVTGHPGSKRLYMQICNRYYNRDLRSLIDKFHCEYCQRNKISDKD